MLDLVKSGTLCINVYKYEIIFKYFFNSKILNEEEIGLKVN